MRTDPLPYEVRELVIRTLEYFDVFLESDWDLDETILIDDGRYSARTYEAEGHMAMWLLDIGIVQFYDPDGKMLRTVNLLKNWNRNEWRHDPRAVGPRLGCVKPSNVDTNGRKHQDRFRSIGRDA